jgi:site-specific DNA-cytosine methylase
MNVLELFCGIGGFAAAAGNRARVVAAVDQSPAALAVYRLNHPGTAVLGWNLETVTAADLGAFPADMWWLSPPCQPYSVRGHRRDLEDPRALSFRNLLEILRETPPVHLGLENVEGFAESRARQRLLEILRGGGFQVSERRLCPTELGIPGRRPRYYLVASRQRLRKPPPPAVHTAPLADYLDEGAAPELFLPEERIERFRRGLRVLDPADPQAYTTCFTSSYGRAAMHSGAFLRAAGRLRHFSPAEVVRLLGFPRDFRWPEAMTLRKRWHLAGNSVSVHALREVLRVLPAFSP